MGYPQPQAGLGDFGIPFIDNLVNKGKSLVADQVQRVTERVADYKLLARTHRALQARLQSLASTAAVQKNQTWANNVQTLLRNLAVTVGQWNTVNNQLDAALAQIQGISVASLTPSLAGTAVALLSGMNDVFSKTTDIENNTKAIEAAALSPAQAKVAASLGVVSPVGLTPLTLALLAGGGFLLIRGMRK